MKKLLFLAAMAFAGTMLLSTEAAAQGKASPHDTVAVKDIKVTYGRPYKKGRVIFGGLEKFGNVWRTGADQATEITFTKDATFGGKPVKAGTYSLFTIPDEKEWTVILNSQLKQWGAYKYNEIKGSDVLQVKVPVKHLENVVEQHTIRFTPKNDLIIEWDQTQVSVPIKI
ncbi:DUF2911 domain-containing protein [Paraflavitalea sp. CAU 1676]|uniref:DUF2911 domain-containing protein n=1 Tax=Paraflavitalea sp. CAU 1676 TaxID=3032598 RepID=UPI0023DA04EC|nr:DUF2911 domain-containing protein [Paraflavitalea sp. CAU 1676]MDF2189950.1 DUF2911 domain-containing protein [Paraflavitalea sp. CAU 1676]